MYGPSARLPLPLTRPTMSRASSTSSSFSEFDSLSNTSTAPTTPCLSRAPSPLPDVHTCDALLAFGLIERSTIFSSKRSIVPSVCGACPAPLPVPIPVLHLDPAPRAPCVVPKLTTFTGPINTSTRSACATLALQRPVRIVGLLATADAGSVSYSRSTASAAHKLGVEFEIRRCEGSFDAVREAIERVNADSTVDGLIVYFPLFGREEDDALRAMISPRVDIEAISPSSLERVYRQPVPFLSEPSPGKSAGGKAGGACSYPCTPLGVVRILQGLEGVYRPYLPLGQRLEMQVISVINRSETVGRPLAAMLANEGALVFSIDIASIHIYHRHPDADSYCVTPLPSSVSTDDCLRLSDLVVSAVPSERYKVPTSSLKEGCVCINVAMTSNFEENVKDKATVFVERMGGVTTACLIANAVALRQAADSVTGATYTEIAATVTGRP